LTLPTADHDVGDGDGPDRAIAAAAPAGVELRAMAAEPIEESIVGSDQGCV
jgi:hypothetical protein